jgi:ribosomal-protein-alanine N-acetyltransferase
MLKLRPYTPEDKHALVALFDENRSPFFASYERDEFCEFLDQPEGNYHVAERDPHIVGCGGWTIYPNPTTAILTWYVVARAAQRQGIGRALIEKCLQEIRAHPNLDKVILDTSQYSFPFFEKFGFGITEIKRDGTAPGLDTYWMAMPLREKTAS